MLTSLSAEAYVGPGLGLGVLGAVVGGVLAVLLAIGGLVWYPIKRRFKKAKAPGEKDASAEQERGEEPRRTDDSWSASSSSRASETEQ